MIRHVVRVNAHIVCASSCNAVVQHIRLQILRVNRSWPIHSASELTYQPRSVGLTTSGGGGEGGGGREGEGWYKPYRVRERRRSRGIVYGGNHIL